MSAHMQHIVIDLEMNKIERRYRGALKLSSELIEIGAVRLDEDFDVQADRPVGNILGVEADDPF